MKHVIFFLSRQCRLVGKGFAIVPFRLSLSKQDTEAVAAYPNIGYNRTSLTTVKRCIVLHRLKLIEVCYYTERCQQPRNNLFYQQREDAYTIDNASDIVDQGRQTFQHKNRIQVSSFLQFLLLWVVYRLGVFDFKMRFHFVFFEHTNCFMTD